MSAADALLAVVASPLPDAWLADELADIQRQHQLGRQAWVDVLACWLEAEQERCETAGIDSPSARWRAMLCEYERLDTTEERS